MIDARALLIVETFESRSAPGRRYTATLSTRNGDVECDCPGFRYCRRHPQSCRHTRLLASQRPATQLRLGALWSPSCDSMITDDGMVIHSVGYTGVPVEALQRYVEAHDLLLVDVRYRPFSRNLAYNKGALQSRFGDRYRHVIALGNQNYKGGPVDLVDEAAGLTTLRGLLVTQSIAVLCVCATPATCHRTVITDALAREGYAVVPYLPI